MQIRFLIIIPNKSNIPKSDGIQLGLSKISILHEAPINEKGESLFLENLLKDEDLTKVMKEDEIRSLFDYDYYTRNVDRIFERVFGKEG